MSKTILILIAVILTVTIILSSHLTAYSELGDTKYKPPLKQLKDGVKPQDVKCNEGKVLVFKKSNFLPICIYSDSVTKLEQRNYIQFDFNIILDQTFEAMYDNRAETNQTYPVRYLIDNGKIIDMIKEVNKEYLDIHIDADDYGVLYVELPREFLDALILGTNNDDLFIVLIDGNEVLFQEIQTTSAYRTLKINFTPDSKLIEILGVR